MNNLNNSYRNLTDLQNEHLDSYLAKSKDTLEEFLEGEEREISQFEGLGWIEYSKYDNILWIHTAFNTGGSHKEVLKVWNDLKDLAREKGCDRIQFTTRRNSKAFERLFNAKTIQYKLEVIL